MTRRVATFTTVSRRKCSARQLELKWCRVSISVVTSNGHPETQKKLVRLSISILRRKKPPARCPKTERRLDPDGKEDYTDYIVGSENYLENTAHHYVIMLKDDGRIEPGLITMAKTAKKKSEKWNSMMTSRLEKGKKGHFNPPSFYYVYHLTTEKAAKGNYTWNTWNITLDGKVESADTYNHCKIFAESVEKGQVTANHEREEIPVEKDAGEAPF
jgi:hypothetical protein